MEGNRKGKYVKCPHCLEYELKKEKDKMVQIKVGKVNRYLHENCYQDYVFNEKVKQKNIIMRDQLGDYLKQLHNIKLIPQNFWFAIEDIRNGSERFQERRKIKNGKREGYNYDVILKAYQLKNKNISWAIQNKKFHNKVGEMNYCLRIAENYLIEADVVLKKEKRKQKIVELHEQRQREEEPKFERREVEYKKREYKHDILDLFE
jgi:hypothetical protein